MDLQDSSGCSTPPTTVSIDTCDSGFTDELCCSNQMKPEIIQNSGLQWNNNRRRNINNDNRHPVSKCQIVISSSSSSNESSESNLSTPSDGGGGDGDGGGSGSGSDINISSSSAKNGITKMDRCPNISKTTNGNTPTGSETEEDEEDDDDASRKGRNNLASCSEENSSASTDDNNDDEEDEDEDEDATSNLSRFSDISDVLKLNDVQRSLEWVHLQIESGVKPRDCLTRVLMNAAAAPIPDSLSDNDLWRIICNMISDPPRRERLRTISSIDHVLDLLRKSKNIMVLTGAGVSVSCGIPDFRSRGGIYARLRREFPEMLDPQSMFDIRYFYQDPRPFYKFAKEIYPGLFMPSPCHRFISLLEKKHKLLRNYSQNIDTLERVAGIANVIECHGSFATASCTKCKHKVTSDDIKDDILSQRIPMCRICNPNIEQQQQQQSESATTPQKIENPRQLVGRGIMKPDIVFFGESLPDAFHAQVDLDKTQCDLLIVIGSSLKVRPVALIPSSLPATVPQILINREQLDNFGFDVELLGDSDVIINQLCWMLNDDWREICWQEPLKEVTELLPPRPSTSLSQQRHQQQLANVIGIEPAIQSNHASSTTTEPEEEEPVIDLSPKSSILNRTGSMTGDEKVLKVCRNPTNDQIEHEALKKDLPPQPPPPPPHSITERLPENSFYRDPPNLYIFPGAEIWWDDSSDDSSESHSDTTDRDSSSNSDTNSQRDDSDTNSDHDDDEGDADADDNHDCNSKHKSITTPRSNKQPANDNNLTTFGHHFLTNSDHATLPPSNTSTNKRKSDELTPFNCSTKTIPKFDWKNTNTNDDSSCSSNNHKKRKFNENETNV